MVSQWKCGFQYKGKETRHPVGVLGKVLGSLEMELLKIKQISSPWSALSVWGLIMSVGAWRSNSYS